MKVTVICGLCAAGKSAVIDHVARRSLDRRIVTLADSFSFPLDRELYRLATCGFCDHVLVERAGALPAPDRALRVRLKRVADAAGHVTVVDAARFARDRAAARWRELVASADVLVINKADCVAPAEIAALEAELHAIQPRAWLVRAVHGRVPVSAILDAAVVAPRSARLRP